LSEERALGIGHRLTLGGLADEALAVIGDGNDRRRGAHAFRVLDDFCSLAIHYGDARIRGAEIDPNDLSHGPHILLFAAGWLGPDGAPIQTPKRSIARDIATVSLI
jgi:NAD-specific glutamate dehydrogenase